jgi:hypothetical protein
MESSVIAISADALAEPVKPSEATARTDND